MADSKINNYRELRVWQKSMDIAKHIYGLTERFPKHQQYGLASQLQRAAVSICSNIAEGHNRRATKEFIYFIRISQGSLAELETQLILSCELEYITKTELSSLFEETQSLGKMLHSMHTKLNEKL